MCFTAEAKFISCCVQRRLCCSFRTVNEKWGSSSGRGCNIRGDMVAFYKFTNSDRIVHQHSGNSLFEIPDGDRRCGIKCSESR
jgi:hypothetical protein